MVEDFEIESECVADSYLESLLSRKENRSMAVVAEHAKLLIQEEKLREYFTSEAAQRIARMG